MKPNPFHVLGLPVSASDEEVAERFRELALTGTQDAGALAEWAKDELMGLPETRELHVLLEVPGTDYRGERWEDFARQYGRPPVAFDARSGPAEPPRAADFDLTAVARRLLDGMLTPPAVDIRAALDNAPVPLRLERPPLEVRDVLFG
ncbi:MULTISPECIES: J domain-containing protein [unclassified Streptomyces]|uniref:J domain-containing protein n=1 Tax=unclassified Streptomyces TaxID=2593676 RepID=UPI002E297D60|nr:J domain-containing protein [Streptomyces sp. NBC_01429]